MFMWRCVKGLGLEEGSAKKLKKKTETVNKKSLNCVYKQGFGRSKKSYKDVGEKGT